MSTLGEKIKEARKSLKDKNGKFPSQEDFAERIGLKSYQAISKYETDAQDPPIETLRQIAKVTGKPVSWFFDEESAPQEIRTVKDVIENIERLEDAFQSGYSIQTRSYQHEDTCNVWLELSFRIPYSYKKVLDDLEALYNARRENNIPDKVFDLWYKSIIDEQSKINIEDMLKEN